MKRVALCAIGVASMIGATPQSPLSLFHFPQKAPPCIGAQGGLDSLLGNLLFLKQILHHIGSLGAGTLEGMGVDGGRSGGGRVTQRTGYGSDGALLLNHQRVSVIFNPLLSFVGAPHLNAMVDKPFQNEGGFTVNTSQTVKHVNQQDVEGFLFRLLSQFLDHVPLGRGNLGAGDAFFGLLCHYPPAVILCELPALDFLERDVIMVHLSFGGDPVGQRRTGRLGGELQLLCVKPAVVQPSLVCFRNLNWIAMIVNVVHFITSLLSYPDGWYIRTTQTIPN